MGQVQNMDVTVKVKNNMSPSHFYSSKEHISIRITLIATRDSETTCARFRDSREIRGPDPPTSHVRNWRSLWHTLLATIDYDYGQAGDTCPAECVMVCLHPSGAKF